ncbi:MAG: ribosome-associated protein [Bacteriovorax sp. MedPE-SWde]|nr:MAG: ribosome-associated protein [Bacteriovorax sp. MedPE-SWde]
MEEFKLNGHEYVQLCDLLKRKGLCQTGGHAKLVISEGEVKVDGNVELRKRCKIVADQVVEYDGQRIKVLAE